MTLFLCNYRNLAQQHIRIRCHGFCQTNEVTGHSLNSLRTEQCRRILQTKLDAALFLARLQCQIELRWRLLHLIGTEAQLCQLL